MKLFGYEIAQEIQAELRSQEKPLGSLAIVSVGDDPVSKVYIEKKLEFAEEFNIKARLVKADSKNLLSVLDDLNSDSDVTGIIVQLPLPEGLDKESVVAKIDPKKDIDGFHYILNDSQSNVVPPTVLAIQSIFDKYQVDLSDGVLIVGGGFLVGVPLARFLSERGVDVEILKKDDREYSNRIKKASVLVIATGGGKVFSEDEFKEGAVVIDASTVSDEQKIRGDVETEKDSRVKLAPVPGGVGPITVAMLFKNFYELGKNR